MPTPSEVKELKPVIAADETKLRIFELCCKDVTVELCSLGASITRLLVQGDDIVLGFSSPLDQYKAKNPEFWGVVVGRVANRIEKGQFTLNDKTYTLECNNGPNHLHGGSCGFSNQNWNAEIIDGKAVEFTYESPDGDEGYPGAVQVKATYSLIENEQSIVKLCLKLEAKLLSRDGVCTPVNLAQHAYFNLARHDNPDGILDHTLYLNCPAYTPVDATLIPTQEIVHVKDDPSMDWFSNKDGRSFKTALIEYGMAKAGLSKEQAESNVNNRQELSVASHNCDTPGVPYGFDHNFIIATESAGDKMKLVAKLHHPGKHRTMCVYTDAPGVQLYSANFLKGHAYPGAKALYYQWQSICLETQHFPSSIAVNDPNSEFAKGKCPILTPDSPNYEHNVEYSFEY